jgi:outer membrane protein assembly factor BamB
MTKAGASYCIISALVILVVYTGISPAQQPCVLWENDLFDENRITDYPGYHVFLYPLISDVIGDVAPEIITGLQYGGYAVLYVLDGRSGSIIWEDRLGGGMYHSIAVVDDGDAYKKIVVGTKDHHLYVFNARTGELLNTIDHGNKIRIISAADINGDGVSDYAVIGDWLNVALYDGRTWEKTWDHVSKIEIDEVSIDDIDQDGSMEVIALCNRNQVLVSDALTGEIEWMHDLGTRKVMIFLNAPNIASAHGIATVYGKKNLFVGTGCGDILALDGKTGTVLHQKKSMRGI